MGEILRSAKSHISSCVRLGREQGLYRSNHKEQLRKHKWTTLPIAIMNCTICLTQLLSLLERIVFKFLVSFVSLFWSMVTGLSVVIFYSIVSHLHVSHHHRRQIQFAASFSYVAFCVSFCTIWKMLNSVLLASEGIREHWGFCLIHL